MSIVNASPPTTKECLAAAQSIGFMTEKYCGFDYIGTGTVM